jgi:hypothetical protein
LEVVMQVTVLYIAGCPNAGLAEQRVREALDRLGRSDAVLIRQQAVSEAQAEALGFRGSPTIMVNRRDALAHSDAPVGLSCRVYEGVQGLAGAPTVDQLVDTLR